MSDNAFNEAEYIESVRNGGAQERLGAVRQLKDEIPAEGSIMRMYKVFEALGDGEGMHAVQDLVVVRDAIDRNIDRIIERIKAYEIEQVMEVVRPPWIYDDLTHAERIDRAANG